MHEHQIFEYLDDILHGSVARYEINNFTHKFITKFNIIFDPGGFIHYLFKLLLSNTNDVVYIANQWLNSKGTNGIYVIYDFLEAEVSLILYYVMVKTFEPLIDPGCSKLISYSNRFWAELIHLDFWEQGTFERTNIYIINMTNSHDPTVGQQCTIGFVIIIHISCRDSAVKLHSEIFDYNWARGEKIYRYHVSIFGSGSVVFYHGRIQSVDIDGYGSLKLYTNCIRGVHGSVRGRQVATEVSLLEKLNLLGDCLFATTKKRKFYQLDKFSANSYLTSRYVGNAGEYHLSSAPHRFHSSYVGSLTHKVRDVEWSSDLAYLKELYHRNDPEAVLKLFESEPSSYTNPATDAQYVKVLVKVYRLDESELLRTLQSQITSIGFQIMREESSGNLAALRNVERTTSVLGIDSALIHVVTAERGHSNEQFLHTFLAFLLISGVGTIIEDIGISKVLGISKEEILKPAECTMIASLSNEHVDFYVLSESSLFVHAYKSIIRTCGTTRLLKSIPPILKLDESTSLGICYVRYGRRSLIFAGAQLYLHPKFSEAAAVLDSYFGKLGIGSKAYVLGIFNKQQKWRGNSYLHTIELYMKNGRLRVYRSLSIPFDPGGGVISRMMVDIVLSLVLISEALGVWVVRSGFNAYVVFNVSKYLKSSHMYSVELIVKNGKVKVCKCLYMPFDSGGGEVLKLLSKSFSSSMAKLMKRASVFVFRVKALHLSILQDKNVFKRPVLLRLGPATSIAELLNKRVIIVGLSTMGRV